MFNQETKSIPRSEALYLAACYRTTYFGPDSTSFIPDVETIKLAQLFAEEERLAAQITEPKTIDKDTIYKVVAMARKIAAKGYATNLVPLDEMLDIAQIFCLRAPILADLMQGVLLEGHRYPQFVRRRPTNTEFLDYAAELITSPSADVAGPILVELLAKLKDKDSPVWKDPVWTARVAAVLAYYSVPQPA